jgi:hypothetical protein
MKSFPPVDALITFMAGVDYKKHYKSFVNTVVLICAIVAAIYTVASEKWVENRMTTRFKIAWRSVKKYAKVSYIWMRNVAVPYVQTVVIPFVKDAISEVRSYRSALQVAFG